MQILRNTVFSSPKIRIRRGTSVYYVILNCNLKSINYNAVILNLIRTNHIVLACSQNLQTLTTTLLLWLHFEH